MFLTTMVCLIIQVPLLFCSTTSNTRTTVDYIIIPPRPPWSTRMKQTQLYRSRIWTTRRHYAVTQLRMTRWQHRRQVEFETAQIFGEIWDDPSAYAHWNRSDWTQDRFKDLRHRFLHLPDIMYGEKRMGFGAYQRNIDTYCSQLDFISLHHSQTMLHGGFFTRSTRFDFDATHANICSTTNWNYGDIPDEVSGQHRYTPFRTSMSNPRPLHEKIIHL